MDEHRVYAYDEPTVVAYKIFNYFIVGQSCSITGFLHNWEERKIEAKGELVWNELVKLDKQANWTADGRRRKRAGANISSKVIIHKVFKYKKTDLETDIKYDIWRLL